MLVDPKGRDYSKYHGATGITPNRRETSDACGGIQDIQTLLEAAETLRKNLSLDFIAVTRSEEGITLLEASRQLHVPAMAKQVFDVSGAGDTVIATLAASMVAGLSLDDALHLANLAAGIVVGQVGTIAITEKHCWRSWRTKTCTNKPTRYAKYHNFCRVLLNGVRLAIVLSSPTVALICYMPDM